MLVASMEKVKIDRIEIQKAYLQLLTNQDNPQLKLLKLQNCHRLNIFYGLATCDWNQSFLKLPPDIYDIFQL